MVEKKKSIEESKVDIDSVLNVISKAGGVKILKALTDSEKTQKELSRVTKMDKSVISRRLREFHNFGLVNERFDHEERVLKYSLTKWGEQVLEGLRAFENKALKKDNNN